MYFFVVFRLGVIRGRFVYIFFLFLMVFDEWDVFYVNIKYFKWLGVYLSKMILFFKVGMDSWVVVFNFSIKFFFISL